MEFNTRLIRYRKERGLSQEELAGRLGVSRQAVSKWETGEALPDLQKALLLAETLGIGLDQLCATDAAAALPEQKETFPSQKRSLARTIFAVVLCLCLGFLLGTLWPSQSPPMEAQAERLPDTISVSGISFAASAGKLTYRFVPSVVSADYSYQITFTGTDGIPHSFDAPCVGGICSGAVELPQYNSYTANVLIECGKEGRSVPIAWDVSYTADSAQWLS